MKHIATLFKAQYHVPSSFVVLPQLQLTSLVHASSFSSPHLLEAPPQPIANSKLPSPPSPPLQYPDHPPLTHLIHIYSNLLTNAHNHKPLHPHHPPSSPIEQTPHITNITITPLLFVHSYPKLQASNGRNEQSLPNQAQVQSRCKKKKDGTSKLSVPLVLL